MNTERMPPVTMNFTRLLSMHVSSMPLTASRLGLLTLLMLASFSTTSQGQTFAEPGTTWKHCLIPCDEAGAQTLIEVYAAETLLFNGIQCTVLRSDEFWKIGWGVVDSFIVCSIGERVYYAEGDTMFLLYDFSVEKGDSFRIKFPVELDRNYELEFPDESLYWTIHVDSVDFVEINDIMLKRQHIRYRDKSREHLIYLGDVITERVGYETWILPFLSVGFLEYNPDSQIQSFSDTEVQFFDTTSCTISGLDETLMDHIKVYPNPFADLLHVEVPGPDIFQVDILNVNGELVRSFMNTPMLNLEGLVSGIYLLRLRSKNVVSTHKIIKL